MPTTLARLLDHTTIPPGVARQLIDGAPTLWLGSNTDDVLAGDLALCHPGLRENEVRARGTAFAAGTAWRLAVASRDRPGLLAGTAAVLSSLGFSVTNVSVATWCDLDIALHALSVAGPLPEESALTEIGAGLRAPPTVLPFTPAGGASVVAGEPIEDGMMLVTVQAQDQIGLLWAICNWFAGNGYSIFAASVGDDNDAGVVRDLFVVGGPSPVDAAALASVL